MKKFFLVPVLIMVFATCEATKIDAYQKILESGRYTIRYENLTPAPRVTNRNIVELYGKNGLAAEINNFFLNRPLNGVIVGDGENRYEEIGYEKFFQCRLVKDSDIFIFTRYPAKNGNVEYFGDDKGKVSANARNYLIELLNGENFGDVNFTEMMTAIISDSRKNAAQRKYKFVASGTLPDGTIYEDFSCRESDKVSAIRCYFVGDVLKKIAFASGQGNHLRKCIVKILEFSPAPEQSLLSLPSGLVDTTKR